MSHLGILLLQHILNARPGTLCERVFAPWTDYAEHLRASGEPLPSLESGRPAGSFDMVGFSLCYELTYTNVLMMLDLAGIPLFSAERTNDHPLVIAGGHAAFNPEPMHAFIDAFVVGEGEDVIQEIIDCYQDWKISGTDRSTLLRALAKIWGVYVPVLYTPSYKEDGTIEQIDRLDEGVTLPVLKRIVPVLPPAPTHFIVPYIDTVHNRVPVEIMRGCTRGCRFCHAGMINRPVRERSVEEILSSLEAALDHTGFEEIGLLSLSSSDYTRIVELVNAVSQRFAGKNLGISLPSLRIESFSIELMDALRTSRRGGFTLAPEAATERMREIINKPVSTVQLLETTRAIYARGYTTIKLYFMIGHPAETMEDVQAIADLCNQVLAEGRKVIGRRARLNPGVSTFVPKPHTPFQWVSCDAVEQIEAKQALLKRSLRDRDIKLTWSKPEDTMLEAWLSRGDRRMSAVVFQAWKNGAKFDAWQDQFRYDVWLKAFEEIGLDPAFYTHRPRSLDEIFPWEHINAGVRRSYLQQDYLMSQQGITRLDCRQDCFACGILPVFADFRRQHPGNAWQCPEVHSPSRHNGASGEGD